MKGAALTLAVALAACGHAPPAPEGPPRDYPGALVPPSAIPGAFLARQQLTFRHGERTGSFQAVLQKDGGTLTLLGLTPFGSRAFVLRQTDTDLELTSYVDTPLPFPARYALVDVHRTWFRGTGAAPRPDGEHVTRADAEEITEVWSGGRLMTRRFRRLDGVPAGTIDIEYEGGMSGTRPPATVVLRNGWFHYELRIATLEYAELPVR